MVSEFCTSGLDPLVCLRRATLALPAAPSLRCHVNADLGLSFIESHLFAAILMIVSIVGLLAAILVTRIRARQSEALQAAALDRIRGYRAAIVKLSASSTTAGEDPQAVAAEITEAAARATRVDRVGIWHGVYEDGYIRCVDLYQASTNQHTQGATLHAKQYPGYAQVISSGELLSVQDAWNHPRTIELCEAHLKPLGIASILIAPIKVAGEPMGIATFEHVGEPRAWIPDDVRFAGEIADHAARTFQNSIRAKAAEAGLISEAKFMKVFLSNPDVILISTLEDGRFIEASDAVLATTGYTRDELVGRTATELGIWDRLEDRDRMARLLEKGGLVRNFEAMQRRKSGQVFCALISAERVTLGGQPCVLATVRDVSERKQAETTLRLAKEAAEAATRVKSEFLAVMSHEIRTPMSGVIGMLDILLRSPQTAEQHRYTEIARNSADALMVILDDILDSSKIEFGKLVLDAITFPAHRALADTVESLRIRAESKGLRLGYAIDPDVPPALVGDPARLRQVVVNLLGNAIKFTDQGGVDVTVSCDSRMNGIAVLRVTVVDTGIGIAEDTQNRLFEKFEQGDPSTTRRYGGAGLGLSICRSLVGLMGGTISVQSELGRGSTFSFTVRCPIGEEENADSEWRPRSFKRKGSLPRHPAKLRVLCAEDNIANQVIAHVLVGGMGHEVDVVDDGAKAVEALSFCDYDAVLMDCRMPVTDGFEATRQIRDNGSSVLDHGVYVIALTANASEGDRDECLAAGMNDYVSKPFCEVTLNEALSRAIEYQHGRGISLPAMTDRLEPDGPLSAEVEDGPSGMSKGDFAGLLDEEAWNEEFTGLPPELEGTVTELYLHDTPLRIEEMTAALEACDATTLARSAHTIKSTSRYVRAVQLSELGAEVEGMADRGELEDMAQWIARIEEEFERLRVQLLASSEPPSAGKV